MRTAGEVVVKVPVGAGEPVLTTTGTSTAAPAQRVRGVDLARGVAVLGMVAVHAAAPPAFLVGDPGTWAGIVHGRSAVLFAALAGVSLALMTGRSTPPASQALVSARTRVLVRAVCLFAVGGLVQLVATPIAVILEYYAVVLVLCLPFLGWRTRRLLLLAAALALVAPSLRVLAVTSQQGLTGWTSWVGSGGELGMLGLFGTYPAFVWWAFALAGLAVGRAGLQSSRVRRLLVSCGVALAVVGYGGSWLAMQAWGDAAVSAAGAGSGSWSDSLSGSSSGSSSGSTKVVPDLPPEYRLAGDPAIAGYGCYDYGDGTAWCAGPGVPGAPTPEGHGGGQEYDDAEKDPGWGAYLTVEDFLGDAPHSGTTPDVLGSLGVALAVLGGCLVVADRLRPRWLLRPLEAVGSMPLTVYCAHLVALAVAGHLSDGAGWLAGGWRLWAVLAVVALVGCTLWRSLLGAGPLERAVSRVVARSTRA